MKLFPNFSSRLRAGAIGCCLFLMAACRMGAPLSEVAYVANPETGVVRLSAIGIGADRQQAEQETYITAFNTILFKGLPGFDALRLPMIEDESKAKREHASFFTRFYRDGGYLQFVTEHGPLFRADKTNRSTFQARRQLAVNYDALRRHLEREGVIRKFGF